MAEERRRDRARDRQDSGRRGQPAARAVGGGGGLRPPRARPTPCSSDCRAASPSTPSPALTSAPTGTLGPPDAWRRNRGWLR